jgi:hypothetical protein
MYTLVYGNPSPTREPPRQQKLAWEGIGFFPGRSHCLAGAIHKKAISTKNPIGTVTNSDLELAASIAQHHILKERGSAGEST